MAQAGYTPISLYHSTTATTVPSASNLTAGELALNIADNDMSMYTENASGTVKLFFNNPAALKYPTADGTSGQTIVTNGSATLSFGTLGVGGGGTGQTSLTLNNVILGNGTSAVQFVAPGASGNVLTSDGTTWTSSTPAATGASKGQAIAFALIFGL
jgi:hypothetical protein